jgi:hypothetical protein
MSRRDFSGQQWLMSVPLLATSGFYSTQSVPTDVPASIYHNDGNSQGPQNHLDTVGKQAALTTC